MPLVYHVQADNSAGDNYWQVGVTSLWLPRTLTVSTGSGDEATSCHVRAWVILGTWSQDKTITGPNQTVTCSTWPLAG
jgi:hypothetical protein